MPKTVAVKHRSPSELRRVLRVPVTEETRREVRDRVAPDLRREVGKSLKRNSDALRRLKDY